MGSYVSDIALLLVSYSRSEQRRGLRKRLENPYSLSYQAAAEIKRLPITLVRGMSMMDDRGSPTIRDEANSSSSTEDPSQ